MKFYSPNVWSVASFTKNLSCPFLSFFALLAILATSVLVYAKVLKKLISYLVQFPYNTLLYLKNENNSHF